MLIKVNVREIEAHKEIRVNFFEEKGVFDIEDRHLAMVKGKISGDLVFSEARGAVLGKGKISYRARIVCSRCLEPKEITIERDFYRIYEPKIEWQEPQEEEELSYGDLDVTEYKGEDIIINNDVRDEVLLGIPEFFFCSVDCRGLCAKCGENLNKHPRHSCKGNDIEEGWKKELQEKYREIKGGKDNGSS